MKNMARNNALQTTQFSGKRLKNKTYINIIASHSDRKDDKTFQEVVEIYQSDEVTDFIISHFKGAAVPVKKLVSFLEDYN